MAAGKATIIGYGHMGQACVEGLVKGGVCEPSSLQIIKRTVGREGSSDILSEQISPDSCLVLLAVKPADFKNFLAHQFNLDSQVLVISMMAGVSIDSLRLVFPANRIVRFMTNLAVAEGRGVGCYFYKDQLLPSQLALLKGVCSSFGDCYQVDTEDLLDSATALVGTLPALFYHFLEGVVKAGVSLGFERKFSELVAQQVVRSAYVKLEDGRSIALGERIGEIASKGGTTEAMLQNLGHEFTEAVLKALQAAAKKSRDLGKFA